jgi:phosphatidylserine/phosphatidylglycerophosphate/cardiolipin synthase-like enzyme
MLGRLWSADEHGRLGVYWPVTDGGTPIYVHAKVLVVDDRLLRIGSSNLNNRSMGFDSECDLAVEADPTTSDGLDTSRTIVSIRNRLICEHLGVPVDEFERATQRCGSFLTAVEELRGHGRTLQQFTTETVANEASLFAENDLMDPDRVPQSVSRSVQRWLDGFTD